MPSNLQIAAVLQKAANLRFDIKRAKIALARDAPHMLLFKIENYTDGTGRDGERNIGKIDTDQTCRQILDDWLGPEPKQGAGIGRTAALQRERNLFFNNTIDQIVKTKGAYKPVTNITPRSKLDWKEPDKTMLRADLPDNVSPVGPADPQAAGQDPNVHPEAKLEADEYRGQDGQVHKKMTRPEMIKDKMTRAQRNLQYRIQRGKHPDDA